MIDMTFEIRAANSTAPVAKEIYSAVHALDPNLPVIEMRTQEQQIDSSLSTERLFAKLAGLFGALGLAMACVGLYGIMAYNVTLRTGEIGVRMALGAERADIVRLVVGQGLVLTLIGVAGGFAGAFALTRYLVSLLYGVRPIDTLTFVAVSLVLAGASLLACYVPVRRATKVDPMVALRHE
jgi:ABC-type antimicrobial peptide transport system permease subunit